MNGHGDGAILDTGQVDRLARELDSRTHAVGFVGRFLECLPIRVARVNSSLLDGKVEGALAAILSVATSAAMAGAVQLEGHSRVIEQNIRAGDLVAARDAAGQLDSNVADFAQQVTKLVSSLEPAGQDHQCRSMTG